MTIFGRRPLVEEAAEPEKFRDAIRDLVQAGGTVEVLFASSTEEAAEDLIALVPPMISYLGHGPRFRAHVIDESRHPLAYGVCVAGDRGLMIARGEGGHAVAVRTNDRDDVRALRDLLRPYWNNRAPIIEEVGMRTRETVAGRSRTPSVAWPWERLLTSVEVEEGQRRLVKKGLSIMNVPVAIHAWKWRAAELAAAGWIPEGLQAILAAEAWELAKHGLSPLPPTVLDQYARRGRPRKALEALEEYALSLHRRQAAWGDQLARHQFWDACPKSALRQFIATGELPPDEIPPVCSYRAERGDIETIITRLIIRLRTSRNYHLALIEDEQLFPQWFYFSVKGEHVLAQVFDSHPAEQGGREGDGEGGHEGTDQTAAESGDKVLNVHINYAPIARALAGWFDERILKAALKPAWQDNRSVADWLEKELRGRRSGSWR